MKDNELIPRKSVVNIKNYYFQIIYVALFFFIFGFITWVNGALIPYLRIACQLNEVQSYLVTFAFYVSYFLMAFPSSYIIRIWGMIGAMKIGLYIMSIGCLIFIPAAYFRTYLIFLTGLFCIGTGLTVLQTAINPFITLLGPPEFATQRISIMSACNKFAGLLAPLIFSYLILNSSEDLPEIISQTSIESLAQTLDSLAYKVIAPYSIIALVLCGIALSLKFSTLPKITTKEEVYDNEISLKNDKGLRVQMFFGFSAIFCCVGAEVVAGDTISNYAINEGVDWHIAKNLTSLTLANMLIGCILSAIIVPKFVSYQKGFIFSISLSFVILFAIITLPTKFSVYVVSLLGLSNAILWPAIWPIALKKLEGKALRLASSTLIMGIVGGAIMPLLYGWLSSHFNNQLGYLVLIPCYTFLLFYWYRAKLVD